MRAYRVTFPAVAGSSGEFVSFVGTRAEATARRLELFEANRPHVKKYDITIEEVEVPTDKTGLIEFINDLLN